MASRFYSITKEEIHQFLMGLGFQPLALKGVVELVYGKIIRVGNHCLSLRCYTAVNPGGRSRERGTDAIRLQLFAKVKNGGKDTIVPVGRSQKCLRVKAWRENLRKAIHRHVDPEHFRLCPACGSPMVIRENRATGGDFWGCCLFRVTGCKGKQTNGTPPTSAPGEANELAPLEIDDLRSKETSS
jgi:hypothetical protein